jgi:methylglutaconyl-CoA hydratase
VTALDTLLHSLSDRGVATITFNRPERANSYDFAMLDTLADLFERFGRDPSVRVIVLRGAGKHFSAGAAIGEGGRARLSMGELCTLIDTTPKPTIAVVQGACIGGALAVASCCDAVVASREAFFSIPEVRLGFAPLPLIGFFARAMGYRALRRYLLSGERFSAEDALRIGLVHELCDMYALEPTLHTLIDQCLLGAPGAIAQAKQVLQQQTPAALTPDELRDLQASFDALSTSEEAAEGRAAFKEKRKPRWFPPGRDG